jgi:hypothetical protein
MKMTHKIFNFYAIAIVVSGVLDVITTLYGISIGLTEGNILSLIILDKFGTMGLIILHLFVIDILLILGLFLKNNLEKKKMENKSWMFIVVIILIL